MRRKITFAFIAMASALTSPAFADGYQTLVFKSLSGETYSVKTLGLEIYYKDGNISFNNDGRIIAMESLASMEFSDNQGSNTGVERILPDSTGPLTVFTIDGIKTGEFPALSEAYKNLAPGVHIVCLSNGETFKIRVK